MKNRKSKLLLSTTLAASAFATTINVDAAQNTSAEKWVKEAEDLAGALKWAISVEGKEGEIPEIPWTLYNQTKQAKEKALEAIKSLSKIERIIYETDYRITLTYILVRHRARLEELSHT